MHDRVYHTMNYPGASEGSVTGLTGIRNVKCSKRKLYITGFCKPAPDSSDPQYSFVYKGDREGDGKWYLLDYPSSSTSTVTSTSPYSAANTNCKKIINVVGSYTTEETGGSPNGFLYQGTIKGNGKWTTILPSSLTSDTILNTICHSTMEDLVVGNYDTQLDQGKSFIYDMKRKVYYPIIKSGAKSTSAYGIWYNGCDKYTIAGSYSNLNAESGFESGYLVDWDNRKKMLSNWRSFSYNNDPIASVITHIDGISTDGKNGFNITGDWYDIDRVAHAYIANIKDKFSHSNYAKWTELSYPQSSGTSGNSVYKSTVVGIYYSSEDTMNSFISYRDN